MYNLLALPTLQSRNFFFYCNACHDDFISLNLCFLLRKKNNKDKKKKTEQSKKNHKDNATCANNLFALSLSLAQEVMASTHC